MSVAVVGGRSSRGCPGRGPARAPWRPFYPSGRKGVEVFEARLTREQWAHLKGALVDKKEDILAVYFLPSEAVGRTWRVGYEGLKRLEDPGFV